MEDINQNQPSDSKPGDAYEGGNVGPGKGGHIAELKQSKSRFPMVLMLATLTVSSMLAVGAILVLYNLGMFDSGPELPEIVEGEASFTSEDGKKELFYIMIDYKQKLVQLKSLDEMTFPYVEDNNSIASTMDTKIVIQDYNIGRNYFILPGPGNSTTQCFYTILTGDMISRHLLKHATLKAENVEGNMSHAYFYLDNDTDIDVYRANGRNGKIYEVKLHLPNGTIQMRSTKKKMNVTDHKHLDCHKYVEENVTFEETFFKSGTSKTRVISEEASSNNSSFDHSQSDTISRRRRGIGWRNGWVDWWYGNWCGPSQGGYRNNPNASCKYHCQKSTKYITRDCRNCLPPKDDLDEACMEHDRCIRDNQAGPWWCQPIGLPCKCDRPFVKRVYNLTGSCSTNTCQSHALQIYAAFQLLSCWYPKRTCFPVIRTKCRCWACLCPRITISSKCIVVKRCDFLGSGKI